MDLFEEISKEKKDFPKITSVTKKVKKATLNFYQILGIGIFVVCFFLGIVFGNLFATCTTPSYFYSDVCQVTQFNFSLMIMIWSLSFLVSTVFFSIGHIIALLSEISEKLTNFNS